MKRQILIVSDDPVLRETVDETMASGNNRWDFHFVPSGLPGLQRLRENSFEAVICDLHLSDMPGARFMEEAAKRQATMQRFIRGDLTAGPAAMKCFGTAQHFISKRLSPSEFAMALDRAFALVEWLPIEGVQRLLSEIRKIPSPPELYFKVVHELQSPDCSMDSVGVMIARDAAMTAKLLQVVNSASLGLARAISDPTEAVMQLGAEATKSLILLAHTFSYFDGISASEFSPEVLSAHSLQTGRAAQLIASMEKAGHEIENACFTAGLLHDLGKLVLAANFSDPWRQALHKSRREGLDLFDTEREFLGASHAEIGSALLAIWGLPSSIVEAVALHHRPVPLLNQEFCPLAAVHAANLISHRLSGGKGGGRKEPDKEYLAAIGKAGRFDDWFERCESRLSHA